MAFLLYAFVILRSDRRDEVEKALMEDGNLVADVSGRPDDNRVYRRRLAKEAIPPINHYQLNYRILFNDSNYVQLAAARANGIDPATVGTPSENPLLVPIFSNRLYQVDTMYHSEPYLLPEAVLLIDYISHRFNQLMQEYYPSIGEHKIIVTSALRTEQSERRLRRVNRNATDTSCHVYGTTFDISAQRYLHVDSGHDTVVDACKRMLAVALYEMRYEGLCYVKYERGSCFHITLRTTQYEGDEKSETRVYVNPGSPVYMKSRPTTPLNRRHSKRNEKNTINSSKTENRKALKKNKVRSNVEQKNKAENNKRDNNNVLSERERLSLEQFERRY